jgi:hypothetical protein
MAHHLVHRHALTPAALRRAAARVRAHLPGDLPFLLYAAGTFGAMAYLLLLTCRAAG